MSNKIPLQCGQRFKVGDDIWQVKFQNGDMATLEKIAPEPEVPEEIKNLLIPIRNLDEAHWPCGKTALEFNCAVLETARRIRESR